MLAAVLLGAFAQLSLLMSGLLVYAVRVPTRVIGAIAGFGAGALIGAVAFELIPEGASLGQLELSFWLLVGAGLFVITDRIVEARFGSEGISGALGIIVGAVVDGIPESLVLGIQVAAGEPVSVSFVAAVWISNVSEALAPSRELADSGWSIGHTARMWGAVVAACAVAAGLGYVMADVAGSTGSRAATVAAGGLLAMLTDSLMPYAFSRGGPQAGVWTVVGFAAALAAA